MSTRHELVTLSNLTATRITPEGLHSGMDITIQNVNETAYVYVGAQNVLTTSYGYRIAPGHAISWELPGTDSLYLISDTNNSKVAVLKTNLELGA
jgi:hypothetical protein